MAWYAPSPSIPPGMDPSGWLSMLDALEVEAARLVARPPGVGARQQLLVLREALRAIGLSIDQAATGSVLLADYVAPQLVKSRRLLVEAQQAHGDTAVRELADFLNANGFTVTANTGALAATVARTQVAITKDWERLAATAQAGVADALRRGMVAGQNPRLVAAEIRRQAEMTYARGLNIARTEMADLYSASRLDYMTGSEHIDGWWWRARPDACPICQALHGELFAADEPPNRHHQCRCVQVPYIPGVTDPDGPRPAEKIEAGLPKSWPKGQSRDYWLGQVRQVDNPGWRPSQRMLKPSQNYADA